MPCPISILMYGQNALLLETRRLVLDKAGYGSSYATDLSEFISRAQALRPDLLIFCHTLPDVEKQRAWSAVEREVPGPKPRVLVLESVSRRAETMTDVTVLNIKQGPAELVAAVELLAAAVERSRPELSGPRLLWPGGAEDAGRGGSRMGNGLAFPAATREDRRSSSLSALAVLRATRA